MQRIHSLRFAPCVWPACGQVFFLCWPHDRGQRYYGEACDLARRRQAQREAGRRYQQTRSGGCAHAAREQDRRDRQRAPTYVTHQGRKKPSSSAG
jgi:hypothetical protein